MDGVDNTAAWLEQVHHDLSDTNAKLDEMNDHLEEIAFALQELAEMQGRRDR